MNEPPCEHDYQLETVGGVYLTGAYVCRICSFRIGMSHEQFHRHAMYPGHYQAAARNEETIEERASQTLACYRQRLVEQLGELTSEDLPCRLSQTDHDEILTDVIEEVLREVVTACTEVARQSGLSQGKAVAALIERTVGGRMGARRGPVERQPELQLGGAGIRQDGSCDWQYKEDRG